MSPSPRRILIDMDLHPLLALFLNEECIPPLRDRLLAEIKELGETPIVRTHTFNRFNLRMDFQNSLVRLDDDLDPGEEGEFELSLADFQRELESTVSR